MQAETAGTILTLCLCGGLGWSFARALSVPVRVHIWVLLVLAVVRGAFVGVDTLLLSVYGVGIRLNVAIVSCAAGMLITLMVRTGRQRRFSSGAA